MSRGPVTVITGGVRSGRSRYALTLASADGGAVSLVATAQPVDEEFRRRIARHQQERPAGWQTLEEPLHLGAAVERAWTSARVVLVDDLTLWVSNRLLADAGDPERAGWSDRLEHLEAALERETAALLAAVPATGRLILVTQEAGWGVVPPSALGRAFRDLLGRLNQQVAQAADGVILMVAGLPVEVKRLPLAQPARRAVE